MRKTKSSEKNEYDFLDFDLEFCDLLHGSEDETSLFNKRKSYQIKRIIVYRYEGRKEKCVICGDNKVFPDNSCFEVYDDTITGKSRKINLSKRQKMIIEDLLNHDDRNLYFPCTCEITNDRIQDHLLIEARSFELLTQHVPKNS